MFSLGGCPFESLATMGLLHQETVKDGNQFHAYSLVFGLRLAVYWPCLAILREGSRFLAQLQRLAAGGFPAAMVGAAHQHAGSGPQLTW